MFFRILTNCSKIVILQVHNLFVTKINLHNSTFPSFNPPIFTGEDGMVLT